MFSICSLSCSPTSQTSIHLSSHSHRSRSPLLQLWRTTVSRWCSSHHGWYASRWPTSACRTRAATSASSTQMPLTTRWRHCQFGCPQRLPLWRWSRRPWRAERWSSPACLHEANQLPPCAGSVMDGRSQVPGCRWQMDWLMSWWLWKIKEEVNEVIWGRWSQMSEWYSR